jgi:hypothetical protein
MNLTELLNLVKRGGHKAAIKGDKIHVTEENPHQFTSLTMVGIMIQTGAKLKLKYNQPKPKKRGGKVDIFIFFA